MITDNEKKVSFQRYLLNILVRIVFFLAPIPVPNPFGYSPEYLHLPIGLTIAILGALVGGILDIFLPRESVIGGKIAVKLFNIGTLSWFEGIEFRVKISFGAKFGAKGKGISVKDIRE